MQGGTIKNLASGTKLVRASPRQQLSLPRQSEMENTEPIARRAGMAAPHDQARSLWYLEHVHIFSQSAEHVEEDYAKVGVLIHSR